MTTVATSSPAAVDNGVNGGGQQPNPPLKEASMTTTAPVTTPTGALAPRPPSSAYLQPRPRPARSPAPPAPCSTSTGSSMASILAPSQ